MIRTRLRFLYDIQKSKQLILVVYGNQNALTYLGGIHHPVISVLEDSPAAADFTAQLIFGGVPATAKLSAKYSKQYRKNAGYFTTAIRLKYTVPEEIGISISDIQPSVDSLAAAAIQGKGAPGMVVIVLKITFPSFKTITTMPDAPLPCIAAAAKESTEG